MPEPQTNLSRLSYHELHELLARNPILEGKQAEAFAAALQDVALYVNEARLQMVHSRAVVSRMSVTAKFEKALILSHIQESVPSFYLSLSLRQLLARGLVLTATKNATLPVIKKAINRVRELPSFGRCPILQRCAAELLLEAIATSNSPESAQEFVEQMSGLSGMRSSPELQEMYEHAKRQAKRAGRDPAVRIDLNQKVAVPVKVMGKLFGMGDFRMKVELRGLEYQRRTE